MAVEFTLHKFLAEHHLTANRVAVEAEGQIARNSVFAMARNGQVKRLDLANLDALLNILSALVGRPVKIGELIVHAADQPHTLRKSRAGVHYTNDELTNTVLDRVPDILQRLKEVDEA